jgi:dTDP-4-dehydrorhamnose reductase
MEESAITTRNSSSIVHRPSSVFVLGHSGMLGHVVARYLAGQGCEVFTSGARYQALPRDPLIEAVRESECEWIVNAAGRIKQECDSPVELMLVNSILPVHLKSRMRENQRLIHASTDCVFSGTRGAYLWDDERDATDAYGLSKILGEAVADDPRCTIIRASIIGPEPGGGHGLMGWFLRQEVEVKGYVNHFWNGITTLEWAKVCLEIIAGSDSHRRAIVQPGVEPAVSKYELLTLISRTWEKEISIKPVNAPEAIDRTLVPTWLRSPLDEQLAEMKVWYYSGHER